MDYVQLLEKLKSLGQSSSLGFGKDTTLSSKVAKDIQGGMGDLQTATYKSIVDNHDLRIARNMFAAIQEQVVVSCRPNKELTDYFRGTTPYTIQLSRSALSDPNVEFNIDIASRIAYDLVDKDSFETDDEVSKILLQQPKITLPNAGQTYIGLKLPEANDIQKYDLMYIIAPVTGSTMNGQMLFDIGDYKFEVNQLRWAGSQCTKVNNIVGINNIIQGGKKDKYFAKDLYCVARHQVAAFNILCLTTISHLSVEKTNSSLASFEVPIMGAWVGDAIGVNLSNEHIGLPMFNYESIKLNKELLNRMMNRNITLSVSDEAMVDYAMSLSWYSYNKRNVELADIKVTNEMARTHLYVAKVLLMREKLMNKVYDLMLDNSNFMPLIFASVAATIATGMKFVEINENITKIIEFITTNLIQPGVKDEAGKLMESWMSIDVWNGSSTSSTSIVDDVRQSCLHHKQCRLPKQKYYCTCCNEKTSGKLNGLCYCCDKIDRICYHS